MPSIEEDAKKMREVRAYKRDYLKKNYRAFVIRLNVEKDKEIIDFLDANVTNMTGYVRRLIVNDMLYQKRKKTRQENGGSASSKKSIADSKAIDEELNKIRNKQ